jgi:hypothetical protein
MLLGKEDHIVGHSPARIWDVAETHCNAYQYDDLDRLMGTVSPRGGIWSGLMPSQGALLMSTAAEVRDAYGHALNTVKIGPCQAYVAVTSDWYVLTEGVTTVTLKATGEPMEMTGLGFYGADELGLAMDTDVGSIVTHSRVSDGRRRLADFHAHQQRGDAICAGDIEGALAGVGDQLDLFLPVFDPDDGARQTYVGDRAAYRAYLEGFLGRFRVKTSREANRLTTDSWVFSEREWTLADTQGGGSLDLRFARCDVLAADSSVRGGIGVAVRV